MKRNAGPYTKQNRAVASKYVWKATTIVRFFDKLGMTRREKIVYLAKEFAAIELRASRMAAPKD